MGTVLAGATAIGLSLGLFGSGGSILTVPVLAYGLGMPEKTAIASSLAIVGGIALAGTLLQWRRGRVVGRCVIAFGGPGMIAAAVMGLASARIPAMAQMVLFAAVVLGAGIQMLRGTDEEAGDAVCGPLASVVTAGAGVGGLTAIIGVGGGFLLVPVLIRFGHLPLPQAIGTSLALIALNALTGLAGQLVSPAGLALDAGVIVPFVAIGTLGLVAGQFFCDRLPRRRLRHGFVGMLGVVAVVVLVRTFGGIPPSA